MSASGASSGVTPSFVDNSLSTLGYSAQAIAKAGLTVPPTEGTNIAPVRNIPAASNSSVAPGGFVAGASISSSKSPSVPLYQQPPQLAYGSQNNENSSMLWFESERLLMCCCLYDF